MAIWFQTLQIKEREESEIESRRCRKREAGEEGRGEGGSGMQRRKVEAMEEGGGRGGRVEEEEEGWRQRDEEELGRSPKISCYTN